MDSTTTLKISFLAQILAALPLSLSQDFTLKLSHPFSYLKTTSTKWIFKLWNWELEFWTWELVLSCVWGREQPGRSGIYRWVSSRPADLVVGPASPISWPNVLSIFLILLCFMLKQGECSFRWKCVLDSAEWRRVGMEVMEVMGGGWMDPMCLPYLYHIHMYMQCKNTLWYYEIQQDEWMVFLNIYVSTVNIYYRFLLHKNYLHGAKNL